MIYVGCAGLWHHYVKFCAKARKDRADAARERQKARDQLQENILMKLARTAGLVAAAGAAYLLSLILKEAAGGK